MGLGGGEVDREGGGEHVGFGREGIGGVRRSNWLTWRVPDGLALLRLAVRLKDFDGLLRAAHVAALSDELSARRDQRLSFVSGDLVLRRGREGNVDLADVGPGPGAVDVLELALEALRTGDLADGLALDFQLRDRLHLLRGDALGAGGDEAAFAVGEGDDGGAELNGFEGGVLGHVARAGDGDALAFEGLFAARGVLDHVFDVLARIVSGWENGHWSWDGST